MPRATTDILADVAPPNALDVNSVGVVDDKYKIDPDPTKCEGCGADTEPLVLSDGTKLSSPCLECHDKEDAAYEAMVAARETKMQRVRAGAPNQKTQAVQNFVQDWEEATNKPAHVDKHKAAVVIRHLGGHVDKASGRSMLKLFGFYGADTVRDVARRIISEGLGASKNPLGLLRYRLKEEGVVEHSKEDQGDLWRANGR